MERQFQPGDVVSFTSLNRNERQPCTAERPCFECTPWLDLTGTIEEVWTEHGFNRAWIRLPKQYHYPDNLLTFAMLPNLRLGLRINP